MITSNDPRYQIVVDSFFIFEFDFTTLFQFIYYSATLRLGATRRLISRRIGESIYIDDEDFKTFRGSVTKLVMDHILKYGFAVQVYGQDMLIDNIDSDLLNLLISVMFAHAHANNLEVVPINEIAPQAFKDLKKGVTPSRALIEQIKIGVEELRGINLGFKEDALNKIENYLADIESYRTSDIGYLCHVVLEDIIIRHLRNIKGTKIKCFYEVLCKSFNPVIHRAFQVDAIISRDQEFCEEIELGKKNLDRLRELRRLGYNIPVFGPEVKFISIDFTMSEDIDDVLDKLDKEYFSDDTHLLIVLYNKKRASFSRSWNPVIKTQVADYGPHVDVITIEDLANFLNLGTSLTAEIDTLLGLKRNSLYGDLNSFEDLVRMKERSLVSLQRMKTSQYWFDKFLGLK